MRVTSIPVVLALALPVFLSLAAKGQALGGASFAEAPLSLKPAVRIEPRLAMEPPGTPSSDGALQLQPETQLTELTNTPPLGAMSSRAMNEHSQATARPRFDHVRPLLDMSR